MWYLVEFTDSHEVAVIPNNWLHGNKCALWPPYKHSERITKAVKTREQPGKNWTAYPIREMYSNENYDSVRFKLNEAEELSDLQTDSEESRHDHLSGPSKRKRRTPDVYSPDSSDDEGCPGAQARSVPLGPLPELSTSTTLQSVPQSTPTTPPPVRIPTPARSSSFGSISTPTTPPPVRIPTPARSSSFGSISACTSPSSPFVRPRQPMLPASPSSASARDVRLFTSIEQLRNDVAAQKITLESILRAVNRLGISEDRQVELPSGIVFPVETVEGFTQLEEQLVDTAVFKIVTNHLAPIGGRDAADAVRRILKHIMGNGLALQYSWYGRRKKLVFSTLKIASILQKVVQRNFKDATIHIIERTAMEWLRTAADRDGGRKKRTANREAASLNETQQQETDSE